MTTVARGPAECFMFRQIQIGGNHNNGDIFEAIVRHNCEQLDIIHMRLLDALKGSTISLAKGETL